MTQTFAVAHPVNQHNGIKSAYNNYQADEPDIVVPTASAQVLPAFGSSPAPSPYSPYSISDAVATTAVATPYTPGKPTIATTPTPINTNSTTSATGAITTIPAASSPAQDVRLRLARMKQRRKANQALAATSGAIAGLIVLGPLGAALLGFTAHSVAKVTGRAAENRVRRRYYLAQQQGVVATPVNAASSTGRSRYSSGRLVYVRQGRRVA
uniref:Uncharacterized protein n=1 Tax=Cyclophora tenuis TaxID=216820 RepID=A0A7S1D399_CYCTE|mmetsp:Transcript_20794/g.35449  ORF Transcript_20794/g.35449 Transcript_20794/m.35449 type:complete len:211 (+) Transcript_20794:42-674(+)